MEGNIHVWRRYRRYLLYRRNHLRRDLLDRSNPFELYGDDGFKARFRFSKETVMDIIRNIGHFLLHDSRGNPLPVALQFLITLRFLATGAFYAINADTVNIHPSTLCRTLDSVLAAINSMRRRVIHFPENDELRTIKHDFAVLSRLYVTLKCELEVLLLVGLAQHMTAEYFGIPQFEIA
ncbi:hypothetical protein C0J52_21844 [Blattella germanica]|nr:hypothetical protein C0J52_21844 [Blattella germanica]